tara:strand:+ start:794 stop:937 length:144 start_codon:yes stop_codon:yes gene_type:complete
MNYNDIKRLHDKLFGPLEVPETGNMLVDDETKLVDQDTNDEETRMWW